jgi:hypothetical protein
MPRIPRRGRREPSGTLAGWDHCGPWPVYGHSDLVGASGRALNLENQTERKQPTFPVPALAGSFFWEELKNEWTRRRPAGVFRRYRRRSPSGAEAPPRAGAPEGLLGFSAQTGSMTSFSNSICSSFKTVNSRLDQSFSNTRQTWH